MADTDTAGVTIQVGLNQSDETTRPLAWRVSTQVNVDNVSDHLQRGRCLEDWFDPSQLGGR